MLALAGDPPADGSDPGGDFEYATELVALVREVDHFSVGVAAASRGPPAIDPTGRPTAASWPPSSRPADFGMTQFFFDAEHYRVMVEELARSAAPRRSSPA